MVLTCLELQYLQHLLAFLLMGTNRSPDGTLYWPNLCMFCRTIFDNSMYQTKYTNLEVHPNGSSRAVSRDYCSTVAFVNWAIFQRQVSQI